MLNIVKYATILSQYLQTLSLQLKLSHILLHHAKYVGLYFFVLNLKPSQHYKTKILTCCEFKTVFQKYPVMSFLLK